MKKFFFILIVLSSCFLLPPASAQTDFEVSVTRRSSQLPSYPAAYIYNPLQYFMVSITNNTGQPAEVYLTCALYYNDSRIVYSENRPSLLPIILSPGVNIIPTYTLEEHFSGRMGLDLDKLMQIIPNTENPLDALATITRLPEGNYRMALYVHPWGDGTLATDPYPQGNIDEDFEIIYSATPPEIITPLSEQVNWGAAQREDSRDRSRSQQKTTKREDDFSLLTSMGRSSGARNALTPQRKLTFRWTPVITSSSYNPQFEYTLKIVAVLPQQNAQDAIDHNPVVVTTTTRNTYVIIDTLQDLKYQFESGMSYAMQVQAVAVRQPSSTIAGIFEDIEISNQGKSQVVTFSWGKARYSIQYNELNAPLDTAISMTLYHDDLPSLFLSTTPPTITYPTDSVDSNHPTVFSSLVAGNILSSSHLFTQASGPNITSAIYIPHIYPFMGDNECTLCQKPLSDISQLTPGQSYYLDIEYRLTYHYHWDTVHATVHYVNGIEADTEADTVNGEGETTLVRHVGKVFKYGQEKKSTILKRSHKGNQNVGLRLTADFDHDSACIYLNWYNNYKSKSNNGTRDNRKGKGLYHTIVYRSIDDKPFVGIACLSSEIDSFTDRDIVPGHVFRYFVRLQISPDNFSAPSNTVYTRPTK